MTQFELMRNWFDNSFQHPDKIKTRHTALYMYIIDHANRLGWKEKFGLPTVYTMEAIGILNYRTYDKTLQDLIEWGFVNLVHKSRNQHSANVIALVKNTKAESKALQNAILNHGISTGEIVKPQTNKTLNNKKMSEIEISEVPPEEKELFKYGIDLQEVILKNANEKNVPLKKVENVNYSSWVNPLKLMIEKDHVSISHLKKLIEYLENPENRFWRKTILDSKGLRRNCSKILSEINSASCSDGKKALSNEKLTKKLESYE